MEYSSTGKTGSLLTDVEHLERKLLQLEGVLAMIDGGAGLDRAANQALWCASDLVASSLVIKNRIAERVGSDPPAAAFLTIAGG